MSPRDAARVLLFTGTLALGGCVGEPEIAEVVDAVAWELRPLQLDPRAEFRVGSGLLSLARAAARWSDDADAEFAAAVLEDLDAVHVGIYELRGSRWEAPAQLGPSWREELADEGYVVVVRAHERHGESHWVLARGLSEVVVVSIEDAEVVVVKVEGALGAVLDRAVRGEDDLVVMARSLD